MRRLTVRVPEGLYTRLTALAARRGESRSALVRAAIEQVVEAGGRTAANSSLDQIEDLVGCVDAPPDLSFNKAHLKGYGR